MYWHFSSQVSYREYDASIRNAIERALPCTLAILHFDGSKKTQKNHPWEK
jgi:hypothetical protein